MPKPYKDRALQVAREDIGEGSSVFFFPKTPRGPVAITAKTIEEAEERLAALEDNQE